MRFLNLEMAITFSQLNILGWVRSLKIRNFKIYNKSIVDASFNVVHGSEIKLEGKSLFTSRSYYITKHNDYATLLTQS